MDLPDSPPSIDDFDEHEDPLSAEAQEAAEPWISAFVARNRDALNESIRRGREDFAAGRCVPMDMNAIMASALARLRRERPELVAHLSQA